jgi:hypothetical protein
VALYGFYLHVEPVEVRQVGGVGANAGHVAANRPHRIVEHLLSPAGESADGPAHRIDEALRRDHAITAQF